MDRISYLLDQIKRGEFDRAKAVFGKGMKSVLTIHDFSQVFDTYAEFGQSILDAMLADEEEDGDGARTGCAYEGV
jgi:pre-mRNA-splicing factor SYF1